MILTKVRVSYGLAFKNSYRIQAQPGSCHRFDRCFIAYVVFGRTLNLTDLLAGGGDFRAADKSTGDGHTCRQNSHNAYNDSKLDEGEARSSFLLAFVQSVHELIYEQDLCQRYSKKTRRISSLRIQDYGASSTVVQNVSFAHL